MASSEAKKELDSVRRELNSIISELDEISNEIRSSFVGIGNDLCSNCLDKAASNLRNASVKLNKINPDENAIQKIGHVIGI